MNVPQENQCTTPPKNPKHLLNISYISFCIIFWTVYYLVKIFVSKIQKSKPSALENDINLLKASGCSDTYLLKQTHVYYIDQRLPGGFSTGG